MSFFSMIYIVYSLNKRIKDPLKLYYNLKSEKIQKLLKDSTLNDLEFNS